MDFLKSFTGFDANKQEQDRQERRGEKERKKFEIDTNGLPKCVDWRDEGYVNPVQNQGPCGCCYTFSACAAIEGQYFKKHGKLIKLSGKRFFPKIEHLISELAIFTSFFNSRL